MRNRSRKRSYSFTRVPLPSNALEAGFQAAGDSKEGLKTCRYQCFGVEEGSRGEFAANRRLIASPQEYGRAGITKQ